MTERIHYQMIISCKDMDYSLAKSFLGQHLGEYFAGATFSRIDGAWSTEGDQFKQGYADIVIESGIKVDCTTLPDQDTVNVLKKAANALKEATNMDFHWVHIEYWPVSAAHVLVE